MTAAAEHTVGDAAADSELIWYAAYGSNLHCPRFDRYRLGGTHPGGTRVYPGFRDRRPPVAVLPLTLPGALYFATESPVWGGGRAFYDLDGPGATAALGYLLRRSQFLDLVAQEMYRTPGAGTADERDLSAVLRAGRGRLGSGRYETLLRPGDWADAPVLTFTAPWGYQEVDWRSPSAAYVRQLGAGLCAAHGWTAGQAGRYLAQAPGATGSWSAVGITRLLIETPPPMEHRS